MLTGARTLIRATEMDVTVIGLQNAGKTSLVRVLAVWLLIFSPCSGLADCALQGNEFTSEWVHLISCGSSDTNAIPYSSIPTVGFNMKRVQKGHVTIKWYCSLTSLTPSLI